MVSMTTPNATNLEALGAKRLAGLLVELSAGKAATKRRLGPELAGTGRAAPQDPRGPMRRAATPRRASPGARDGGGQALAQSEGSPCRSGALQRCSGMPCQVAMLATMSRNSLLKQGWRRK